MGGLFSHEHCGGYDYWCDFLLRHHSLEELEKAIFAVVEEGVEEEAVEAIEVEVGATAEAEMEAEAMAEAAEMEAEVMVQHSHLHGIHYLHLAAEIEQ